MSSTLSAVLEGEAEAKKMAGLRRGFPIRLGTVRARLLGLSREDERALRRAHLLEGVDWHEFGNGLCYSERGLEKLESIVAGAGPLGAAMTNDKAQMTKEIQSTKHKPGCQELDSSLPGPCDCGGPRGTTGPTIRGLLAERVGEVRGTAFLVRTMRCHFPNTQVVEVKVEMGAGVEAEGSGPRGATGPTSETRGFMRVRSSENFLPGMLCWARTERGASNWVFVGRGDMAATETPICPRSRGRW